MFKAQPKVGIITQYAFFIGLQSIWFLLLVLFVLDLCISCSTLDNVLVKWKLVLRMLYDRIKKFISVNRGLLINLTKLEISDALLRLHFWFNLLCKCVLKKFC